MMTLGTLPLSCVNLINLWIVGCFLLNQTAWRWVTAVARAIIMMIYFQAQRNDGNFILRSWLLQVRNNRYIQVLPFILMNVVPAVARFN